MGGQRFFLKDIDPTAKQIVFPRDISHQIKHVLRYQTGQQVTVLDGEGVAYQVVIDTIDQEQIIANVINAGEIENRLPIHITLHFPLSRREKVEWILQKGTEVGVNAFQPFTSDRSLVQKENIDQKKITRWESIIREAAEQSGRAILPELFTPQKLSSILNNDVEGKGFDLSLVASVAEKEQSLSQALDSVISSDHASIALFIGAEGGFSDQELAVFEKIGVRSVSLGMHVLRMETAAIVFPSLVIHHLSARSA